MAVFFQIEQIRFMFNAISGIAFQQFNEQKVYSFTPVTKINGQYDIWHDGSIRFDGFYWAHTIFITGRAM